MFLLRQSTHRMLMQYHRQVGHLYVPNVRARIPNELGGYFVETNSEGFRSSLEFSKTRHDRPRILFFGDSYTAGDGCNNDQRFADLVGEALDAEVFNYGLSGSGTDQQLLICEQFARDVEADLIVLCITVENIERIKVGYRKSIERVTRNAVLVPKPYFTLEGGDLRLHHVPVPLDRPRAEPLPRDKQGPNVSRREGWINKVLNVYLHDPKMATVRRVLRSHPELRSKLVSWSGFQPYPDYETAQSPGWQLMEAILKRFFSEASPTPVLVVPIPKQAFYLRGVSPIYQKRYESLAAPERGVHVLDITQPLLQLPREERGKLEFRYGGHFTPFGHQQVARLITEGILTRNLLPNRKTRPALTGLNHELHAAARRDRTSPSPKPIYVLGLSCFYHNSAACLIKDGEIVAAAEEERFTRVKSDRRFPHYAANYCLEEGGIHQHDLTAVVYYDNASLTFERVLHTQLATGPEGEEAWLRVMPSWLQYKLHIPQLIRRYLHYDGPILQETHHRSHAASAFYPSPFERAAILTVDGVGEWSTASIGVGNGNRMHLLKEMRFPHSLGLLYSAFTQFTGFKVNSGEYKMMGLAPYGEPKYVDTIYKHLVDLKKDGSAELNMGYFAFLAEPTMTSGGFADLFGGPGRQPESRITKREMDLARSVQVVLEEAILRMARYAHEVTGERRLCLAGGVALNCVANGRLLREGPFEDIWIQPAAGDAGGALGAALDAYHTYFKGPASPSRNGDCLQGGSYLGPEFSHTEIQAYLDTHGYPYRVLTSSERAETIARFLADGKVVGHFSGRVEFGPRALGARSILGDARNQDMQANLNLKIKYRESFRPFAPAVLAERVGEYFELDRCSPYMLLVAPVNENRRKPFERGSGEDLLPVVKKVRSDIPAVTHVDYSARVQTIEREAHPLYYGLIHAFERLTGYAVIVNTSFNVRDEPIVCTPDEAYRCFMRTEMDVLILGDCLLVKEGQPEWRESERPVQKQSTESAAVPRPFVEALRKLHREEFLPVSAMLQNQHTAQVSTKFQGASRATTWLDYSSEQSPQAIFSIPPALDVATPNPQEMAEAISSFWTPGTATDALKPILARLLEVGQRFPQGEELEEQVSDSVYVMY